MYEFATSGEYSHSPFSNVYFNNHIQKCIKLHIKYISSTYIDIYSTLFKLNSYFNKLNTIQNKFSKLLKIRQLKTILTVYRSKLKPTDN